MQQDKYIPTINLTVPTGWDKLDDLVAHARHRPCCKHTCRLTHSRIQGIDETNDKLTDAVLEMQEVLDEHIARLNAIGGTSNVLQYFNVGNSEDNKVVYSANCYNLFNGAGTMATAALVINGATDQKAGAMTAAHVIALNAAKTDITALKAAMQKVQGSGALVDDLGIFGMITRKDVDTGDIFFDAVLKK